MAYEVKNDKGETTKLGGKLTDQDPGTELADTATGPPMPPAPSEKYQS